MIKISDDHAERLLRMRPEPLAYAMGEELEAGAQAIVDDARESILDGAVSGSKHVASLPGEAPNADTHVLDQSLHVGDVIETPGLVQTSAIADAPYAFYLELGTTNMTERPFLGPATRRQQAPVFEALAERFRHVTGIK